MARLSILVALLALCLLCVQTMAIPVGEPSNSTIIARKIKHDLDGDGDVDYYDNVIDTDLLLPAPMADSLYDKLTCFESYDGSDAHERNVLWAVNNFCKHTVINYQRQGRPAWIGVEHEYVTTRMFDGDNSDSVFDDVYQLKINEYYDPRTCEKDKEFLNFYHPKGPTSSDPYDCISLLWGAWRQCNNQGRGGTVRSGCMDYTIFPIN